MPLWIQAGGIEQWVARLKDPAQRARAMAEMRKPDASENTKLAVQEHD
jgi:N-acyl-D-amino-acid deacylase